MFTSCTLAAVYFVPHSSEMIYLMSACGLLVLTGSFDDRFDLHYYIRLVIQGLAAVMLIWGANTQLISLGNLFGLGEIVLGPLSIPVTFLAVIGMINAFNMIDGIDGLSAGLTLISSAALYFLIGEAISDGASTILILMMGALTAYLILNLHIFPNWTTKIFMGDAGSMVLGFITTAFLIRYSQGRKEVIMPVTALWIAAVPLLDIFVTIIRRIRHKKNPLHPDRTHVHHIFIRAGFKKDTALIAILAFHAMAVSIGIILDKTGNESISIVAFVLLFFLYLEFIKHAFKAARTLRKLRRNG